MKDKTKYPDHIWATLSWPEIQERLKLVDTAILPCGAIEGLEGIEGYLG